MAEASEARQPPRITAEQKYDRQIRVWGEHGQSRLQAASVCLINASATGTETLKNLVLPGIGSFTIIDGSCVTDEDHGNNFFLTSVHTDPAQPPRNRALVAMEAMQELNESVEGSYIPEDVSNFITSDAAAWHFFKQFSLVIVSQLGTGHRVMRHIAAGCFQSNIPLINVRSYGLMGYLRIQAREHCVLDSKESDQAPDLRLHAPFAALEKYVARTNLSAMTETTVISHVPFVAILAKAVARFRERHDGQLPRSRADKDRFAAMVEELKPAACPDIAENFEEATKRSNLRLCYHDAGEIPFTLRSILNDDNCDPSTAAGFVRRASPCGEEDATFPEIIRYSKRSSHSSLSQLDVTDTDGGSAVEPRRGADKIADDLASFWSHASAVKTFLEQEGTLPLRGSLPDMTADTESYIALQKIYSDKANADAKIVLKKATELAERYGTAVECDEASAKEFCRRLSGVRIYRTRSLDDELGNPTGGSFMDAASMEGALDSSGTGRAAPFYALFRAVDCFYREHGHHAGADHNSRASDAALLYKFLAGVKDDLGLPSSNSLWKDEADEMVRYANTELHNIASFMGGVAAQEATKLLTRQFVPIENTLIVNFASQASVTFAA